MRLDEWADFDPALDHDEIDMTGAEAFAETPPGGWYASDFNGAMLVAWCHGRKVPCTFVNLTAAFRDLLPDDLLEQAPRQEPQQLGASEPFRRGARPLPKDVFIAALADENEDALRKLVDDPRLDDAVRKSRDEKLRRLYVKSRNEHRTLDRYHGAKVVI